MTDAVAAENEALKAEVKRLELVVATAMERLEKTQSLVENATTQFRSYRAQKETGHKQQPLQTADGAAWHDIRPARGVTLEPEPDIAETEVALEPWCSSELSRLLSKADTPDSSLKYTRSQQSALSSIETIFKKMDSDGDGKLSLTEFQQILDGSGYRDLDEAGLVRAFQTAVGPEEEGIDLQTFVEAYTRNPLFKMIVSDYDTEIPWTVDMDKFDTTKSTAALYRHEDYKVSTKDQVSKHHDLSDGGVSDVAKYDEAEHGAVYGEYANIRKTLDYSYHINVNKERQEWQDSLVKHVVAQMTPQTRPWLVYTCGPTGAGKGYVMSWLSKCGIFPLENVVHIDSDRFKRVMREWDVYLEKEKEQGPKIVGTRTHKESCIMQELAQEAALESGQNTWIDCTLRDYEWFTQVFKRIRKQFPHYRIAIFYITLPKLNLAGGAYAYECDTDEVKRRAEDRGRKTNRYVPMELIEASIRDTATAVEKLRPMVNFVATVNNREQTPSLMRFDVADLSGNWAQIASRFSKVLPAASDFPHSMAPLACTQLMKHQHGMGEARDTSKFFFSIDEASVKILEEFNKDGLQSTRSRNGGLPRVQEGVAGVDHAFLHAQLDLKGWLQQYNDNTDDDGSKEEFIRRFLPLDDDTLGSTVPVRMSLPSPVSMDVSSATIANIPAQAKFFTYCYGIWDRSHVNGRGKRGPRPKWLEEENAFTRAIKFLLDGGFVYFDRPDAALQSKTCFEKLETMVGITVMESATTVAHSNLVQFGDWEELSKELLDKLENQGRWEEVSIPTLIELGAVKYAWLLPSEVERARYGAFAYEFTEDMKGKFGKARFYPIVQSTL